MSGRPTVYGRHIVHDIVDATGVPLASVRAVMAELACQIRRHLVDRCDVQLQGLGTLSVRPTKANNAFKRGTVARVHFRGARALKEQLKEQPMDKYGVDEGQAKQEMEKRAEEGCPWCGTKLAVEGQTLLCPRHGSAPFEVKGAS